jgi:RNA polymerase sigma-70 factor (ECF subfamily)
VKSAEQRFEELYETHFARVSGYVLARTDWHSAAEAVAQTFEVAWRRLPDVPLEPLPWLLGVARRVLADQRRAQGRRDALFTRLTQTNTTPANETDDELGESIRAAIAQLSPLQQEALLLISWDGLSEREAAAALGCSRGAIALRLHRARRLLRVALSRSSPRDKALGQKSPAAVPVHASTEEHA